MPHNVLNSEALTLKASGDLNIQGFQQRRKRAQRLSQAIQTSIPVDFPLVPGLDALPLRAVAGVRRFASPANVSVHHRNSLFAVVLGKDTG